MKIHSRPPLKEPARAREEMKRSRHLDHHPFPIWRGIGKFLNRHELDEALCLLSERGMEDREALDLINHLMGRGTR